MFQFDSPAFSAICPICSNQNTESFFRLEQVPINVCVQYDTREDALNCNKADIELVFCDNCGYIWNKDFDAGKLNYSEQYENSLFYSPLYENYTRKLAGKLIKDHHLYNKKIIDIGCGKGDFLKLMCEIGDNRGIGFDTSFDQSTELPGDIEVIPDFYSEKYSSIQGDMICSRYVFEHIDNPKNFLEGIRSSLDHRREAVIYFEVPNSAKILEDMWLWDIIYEHCGYFTSESLENVFRLSGFEILKAYESYGRQFLGIEAVASSSLAHSAMLELGSLKGQIRQFRNKSGERQLYWDEKISQLRKNGNKVLLWGVGSRGVNFLNSHATDIIEFAIDVNPRKAGKYIAGTGQRIMPPEFVKEYKPDAIILTNSIYQEEIAASVRKCGLEPQYIT